MSGFDLSDYNTVAERITEFGVKHPEGSLQQVSVEFLDFAGQSWVVYTAAAYRSPEDPTPGQGSAWEPVPGKTPYTRDSELQNAETAAWGRAVVAALAADTRKSVATRDEVEARRADPIPAANDPAVIRADIARIGKAMAWDRERIEQDFAEWSTGQFIAEADVDTLQQYRAYIDEERKHGAREHKQLVADVNNTTQAGKTRKDSPDRGRVERSDDARDAAFEVGVNPDLADVR